jgi:hypothetical protein
VENDCFVFNAVLADCPEDVNEVRVVFFLVQEFLVLLVLHELFEVHLKPVKAIINVLR